MLPPRNENDAFSLYSLLLGLVLSDMAKTIFFASFIVSAKILSKSSRVLITSELKLRLFLANCSKTIKGDNLSFSEKVYQNQLLLLDIHHLVF